MFVLELKVLERANNHPVTFPWWCVILGYILCGVCIANGVWWPYLYSIQWGSEVALEWLTSLALSLFQSVLVIQPLKVSLDILQSASRIISFIACSVIVNT